MKWQRIVYIPDFQRHPHHFVVGSSIMFYPDYNYAYSTKTTLLDTLSL